MKLLSRLTALLLVMILAVSAIPVYATDSGKFISINVENIDSYGDVFLRKEPVYNVKGKFYVSKNFLTNYTPYYYNDSTNAFIRTNQPENSIWGQVKIDYDKKEAVLKLNIYNEKTYKLSDIYKFGEEYFLPLDEMAALLKSEVKANDKTLRIVNSGYSLADAEYAFTLLEDENILRFDLDDIVDDVYAGDDNAFKGLATVDFLGSLIIGLKLENIISMGDFGTTDNYYEFFEKCITDNDNYIEATSKQDDLIGNIIYTQKANKELNDHTKQMGKYFGIIKDVVEPLKYSDADSFFLYTKSRDMNALFDTLSGITEAADFILKVGSMCEDNKDMIINLRANCGSLKSHPQANDAMNYIEVHYGQDYATNVSTKLTTEISKIIVAEIAKKTFPQIDAIKIATKIIDEVAKAYGTDITSDKEVKLMVNVDVKHILNNYFFSFKDYSKNEKSSEEYRTAVIFFLLTCKHLYIESNEAAKQTISENINLYRNEITKIDDVLSLFYSASQSKKADNFEDIDSLIKVNTKNIKKSGISKNAKELGKDEFLKLLDNNTVYINSNVNDIKASKNDFQKLESLVYDIFDFTCLNDGTFNSNYSDYFDVLSHFFIGRMGYSWIYSNFFQPEERNWSNHYSIDHKLTPDPLNRLGLLTGFYTTFNFDNLIWLLKNVYNLPEESYSELYKYKNGGLLDICEDFYLYKGTFYGDLNAGGTGAYTSPVLVETKELPNNKYLLTVDIHNNFLEETEGGEHIEGNIYIIVSLKECETFHFWSIYYISENTYPSIYL